MQSALKKWFVIVNPVSGNGKAKKSWSRISYLLTEQGFNYDFSFTQFSGHATDLAIEAIEKGIRDIICVGGDGTLHHTVNGILKQQTIDSKEVSVGIIPIGTGNDWIKTHSIPKTIKNAIKVISYNNKKLQDVGKLTLKTGNKTTYFINLAGVGFDGYVVSKVEKFKKYGAIAYLIGAINGITSFKNFEANIKSDNTNVKSSVLMILFGLCKYSGGGMQLTKFSSSSNGLFDVSIAKNFSRFDIIKNILKLFNGKIVNFNKVDCLKSDKLIVEVVNNKSAIIEADGELVGQGSFNVELLPKRFSFYC